MIDVDVNADVDCGCECHFVSFQERGCHCCPDAGNWPTGDYDDHNDDDGNGEREESFS